MQLRLWTIGNLILLGALVAAPARAEGFISPYIGNNFGGDAGRCPSITDCSSKHFTWGIAAGFMNDKIVGLEEDVSFSPNFFGNVPTFGDNSLLTAMTHVIVGAPLGPVRPFVLGGAGVVHTTVHVGPGDVASADDTTLGWDVGAGVMGFVAPHVGLRGGYQFLRGAKDITINNFQIVNTKLRYQRATIGVVVTF